MRDSRILLSLDGPYSNVMKLKPPMKFNEEDAKNVTRTLDKVLGELFKSSKL